MWKSIKERNRQLLLKQPNELLPEEIHILQEDQARLIQELERLDRNNAELREALLRQAGKTGQPASTSAAHHEMATRLKDALWE